MKMETIVVATDFSDPSQAALELGSKLAAETGARISIVHVESPELMYGGEELDTLAHPVDNPIAQQLLEQVIPSHPDVPFDHHLLTGSPADEIVRFAEQASANLIVVGTHGRSGAMRLLLGSVAELVVRHASCPVLTVKGPPSKVEESSGDSGDSK